MVPGAIAGFDTRSATTFIPKKLVDPVDTNGQFASEGVAALPVFIAELIKWTVGRGRPFVSGKADAFNFVPFTGTEAYFSFPSAHAVTAFALAFAIAAIWPRWWVAAVLYALLIGAIALFAVLATVMVATRKLRWDVETQQR